MDSKEDGDKYKIYVELVERLKQYNYGNHTH